jgi:hypothetical protein
MILSPKRIQLPDDFYKYDFKQLAKVEKHPRTRIRFIGLSHIDIKRKIKPLNSQIPLKITLVKS